MARYSALCGFYIRGSIESMAGRDIAMPSLPKEGNKKREKENQEGNQPCPALVAGAGRSEKRETTLKRTELPNGRTVIMVLALNVDGPMHPEHRLPRCLSLELLVFPVAGVPAILVGSLPLSADQH